MSLCCVSWLKGESDLLFLPSKYQVKRRLAAFATVRGCTPKGESMGVQALFIEILLSGFFAIACFRARSTSSDVQRLAPRRLFVLIGRLERLRLTRWQWCSMVMVLMLARMWQGQPLVAELTAFAQFLLFLVLPSEKAAPQVSIAQRPLREALRRS